jgi:hypothetical protein
MVWGLYGEMRCGAQCAVVAVLILLENFHSAFANLPICGTKVMLCWMRLWQCAIPFGKLTVLLGAIFQNLEDPGSSDPQLSCGISISGTNIGKEEHFRWQKNRS